MELDDLLAKLSDASPGGPLDRLAALSVEALLAKPVKHYVTPALAADVALQALAASLASKEAAEAFERRVEDLVNAFAKDGRTLEALTPEVLTKALRQLTRRPFSPDKRVVLTVIDREPTRELVRAILLTTVLEFGRRVAAPMSGVAKGLGSLARFATDQVKARSGGLGSLVGAVSDEVERQLEKRAVEFVDSALGGVFHQFADALSDPKSADEAAELRVELLNGALELTLKQLSRELANADVAGGAALLKKSAAAWLATPEARESLEAAAARLLAKDGDRPLKELLVEWGLLEVVTTRGATLLKERLADVTSTPGFAGWLKSLA